MPTAFYPPARPLGVGEVLDLAFRIFKATLVRGLPYGICAMIAGQLPNIYDLGSGAARQPFGGGRPAWVALFLLGVLVTLIAWSALLLRQQAIIEHRPTRSKSELAATLRRLPSFVATTLLVLLAVGAGFAVLLVVPRPYRGVAVGTLLALSSYVGVLLSCAWPAVLFAGEGPAGALRHSVRLVWGNWWRVASIYAVGAAVVLVIAILVAALIPMVVPALLADIPVMMAVLRVAVNALGAVAAPFFGALVLAAFGDLRVRREGIDLQQRIADLAVE